MLVLRNPLPGSREIGYVDAALRNDELVVVPTDTVYGIAALASSEAACAKLYDAKQRDTSQPIAVVFARIDDVLDSLPGLSTRATIALEALFPGPFTIIVANGDGAYPWLCGDTPQSIGIRVPAGAEALPPVAATSANLHGDPESSRPESLPAELFERVACAVDRGELPAGGASTVLDLTAWELGTGDPVVLRDTADRAPAACKLLSSIA